MSFVLRLFSLTCIALANADMENALNFLQKVGERRSEWRAEVAIRDWDNFAQFVASAMAEYGIEMGDIFSNSLHGMCSLAPKKAQKVRGGCKTLIGETTSTLEEHVQANFPAIQVLLTKLGEATLLLNTQFKELKQMPMAAVFQVCLNLDVNQQSAIGAACERILPKFGDNPNVDPSLHL